MKQSVLSAVLRKIPRLTVAAALAVSLGASVEVRPAQADHWILPAIAGAFLGAAIVHHSYRRHRGRVVYRAPPRPYYAVGYPVYYAPVIVPFPVFQPYQKRRYRR